MSDTVQIVIIVAVAVVLILFIFRRQLSDFRFKGGKEGVNMQLKTHKPIIAAEETHPEKNPAGTSVSGNRLWGRKNKVTIQSTGSGSVSADDNQLLGEGQEISLGTKTKKRK